MNSKVKPLFFEDTNYFTRQNPVGKKQCRFGYQRPPTEIIGVVENGRTDDLTKAAESEIYLGLVGGHGVFETPGCFGIGRSASFRWNRWGGSAGCNPDLDLPRGNTIYFITMPDRRPQFEQDWLDSVWAVVIILAILFLR